MENSDVNDQGVIEASSTPKQNTPSVDTNGQDILLITYHFIIKENIQLGRINNVINLQTLTISDPGAIDFVTGVKGLIVDFFGVSESGDIEIIENGLLSTFTSVPNSDMFNTVCQKKTQIVKVGGSQKFLQKKKHTWGQNFYLMLKSTKSCTSV